MGRLDPPTHLTAERQANPALAPAESPREARPDIAPPAQGEAPPRYDPAAAAVHRMRLAVAAAGALMAGLALAAVAAPAPAQAPELIRLLHGMVLIKGTLALAAGALVWWRLGRPIEGVQAVRYTAALCLSAAALGWLWGLHLVWLGSLLFYAGLAGTFFAARWDRLIDLPRGSADRT